ncbi:MAG TPA: aminotransferase class I/II-fold pyridoxal phosphate-dependent enzyme [Solirubrobacteraceae bacterium]|jgi:diguanylate cyclase (GGDEF)-like protein|nr:aminotransferase class I/II-fold pyridoxal phosphate-dependent enzyme [Solirubrobacteraceae bacterium]
MRKSLLPLDSALGPRERRILGTVTAVLIALVVATGAHAIFGIGGSSVEEPIRDWITSAVYILVGVIVCWRAVRTTESRKSWMIFAFGISIYGLGNVLWAAWIEHLPNPPIPSICDGMWLTLYPCCYIGIVGLARLRERRVPARMWLDGIVAGLGIAAIGAAIVVRPVLATVSGGTAAVITEMAYPLCDLLLAALVVGVLALRGWRLDRMWAMLGAGFIALAAADCLYALQVAHGASAPSALTNMTYDIGVMLLALAAWQPGATIEADTVPSTAVLGIPAAFTVSALGLLVYDHFSRLDPIALTLAMLTMLAAFARIALTFRDVRALAETRRQAMTDDLTSMPNRRHFLRRVHDGIIASRATGASVALLLVDLDHFKELNDTLGHDAGDQLLCQVGERLRTVLRATDTAARLGGDEFGVLLAEPCDGATAALVAEKILKAIAQPFPIKDVGLRVTASIGIALFPENAENDEQLMQHADVAMYEAKAAQSGYARYARERDKHSLERLTLAGELSHALEAGEIEAHFQPKADAGSRRIVGVEALVRWQHPTRGLISPAEFVTVAEQAGLGRALTRRMLDLALTQVRVWRDEGFDLHVAVNTTVADLQDTQFPAEVAATLQAHGLPPEALVLEVTENMVLADPVRVGDVLAQLGELGLGLSLDDFGTGFSSLTHLKSLPVGEVKIDRSFVGRMTTDPVDAAIVQATIQLAHSIGIRVVAEGIEDQVTWSSLVANRCELVQGYALSRPLPAIDLDTLLRAQPQPVGALDQIADGRGQITELDATPLANGLGARDQTNGMGGREQRDGVDGQSQNGAGLGAPSSNGHNGNGHNGRPANRDSSEALRDLTALTRSHPMMDAVIEEIDGRMIRVGSQWLADFASCNYLGFDLDREIIDAVPAYLDTWGTHPSWSRLLGSPVLYEQIEQRLTALLGSADSLVLPTITHIHLSTIPVLAGSGTIFLDARAHKTVYDGCQMARARGATVKRFRFEDPQHLDELLRGARGEPRLVCMDGVNSMTGNPPDIRAFAAVAREHGALLYVDDAHGFGVIGERGPAERCPYGMRGNSIVRYHGESYESLILVGGFSKSYSSLLAFIACPTEMKEVLKVAAPPYLYSGPSPVASLATTLAGFDVNERRGEELRERVWTHTSRVLDRLAGLGVFTPNQAGMPIVEVPLRDHARIGEVGQLLFDRGVYVTLAAYPLVPRDEVGFRVQLTAANTDAEVDTLIAALEELAGLGELRAVEQESPPTVERASAPSVEQTSAPQAESVA